MMFGSLFLSAVLALANVQLAYSVELVLWEPGPEYPAMILPMRDRQTPEQAVQGYLAAVRTDPRIAGLRGQEEIRFPKGKMTRFVPRESAGAAPLFGLSVNRLEELSYKKVPAIQNIVAGLSRQGAWTYVVPVVADIALPENEKTEFRQKLSRSLDALLIKGGPDIDPRFYGQTHQGALNTLPARDEAELALAREFARAEHGMLYGICRGHQLCAVAHGHELIQDIETETAAPSHRNTWHKIRVAKDSLLFRILGKEVIQVNSRHHQSVIPKINSGLRVTAKSTDGADIVEAAEFENRLGFSFQFHPEDMGNRTGTKIMRAMAEHAKLAKAYRISQGCMKGFEGLLKKR